PPTAVGKISIDRLRAWVSTGMAESLRKLAAQDTAWLPVKSSLEAIEKLLHIQRDFARFLRNFVSFADFYQRGEAIFLAGTLYVDSRSCDLCVQVGDVAKHAVLAGLARTYIVYCDCTRL